MENNLDKSVRHVVQTILSQIVDVNNHVRAQQDNKELAEGDKIATTNFGNYHLTVLSILLHDFEQFAYEQFPDAKGIIDWAKQHYNLGLEKNMFKPCACKECVPVVEVEKENKEELQ